MRHISILHFFNSLFNILMNIVGILYALLLEVVLTISRHFTNFHAFWWCTSGKCGETIIIWVFIFKTLRILIHVEWLRIGSFRSSPVTTSINFPRSTLYGPAIITIFILWLVSIRIKCWRWLGIPLTFKTCWCYIVLCRHLLNPFTGFKFLRLKIFIRVFRPQLVYRYTLVVYENSVGVRWF